MVSPLLLFSHPNMFPSPSNNNTDHPLIFPYQQDAFNRLCAIARATVYCNFENLPIKPRTNVFIVSGPEQN